MNGRQTAALLDEVNQCPLLCSRNLRLIGINKQAIKSSEFRWREIIQGCSVGNLDPALRENGLHLLKTIFRMVMTVIAQKEHSDARLFLSGLSNESECG